MTKNDNFTIFYYFHKYVYKQYNICSETLYQGF